MTVDKDEVRDFPIFSGLDDAALDEILAVSLKRRYRAGERVFEQGGSAAEFFILTEGRLKVTQVTADGQQVMIRIVNPGELFGIAKALQRADYPGTATAAVESAAIAWPMTFWSTVVENHAPLAVNAMRTVGQRLQESHSRIRELATQEVERRIANAVLRLAKSSGRMGPSGIRVDFPISRQDIAEMTGATLHTVSRVLSAWERRGLVEGGRQKLTVCDMPGLSALAGGEES